MCVVDIATMQTFARPIMKLLPLLQWRGHLDDARLTICRAEHETILVPASLCIVINAATADGLPRADAVSKIIGLEWKAMVAVKGLVIDFYLAPGMPRKHGGNLAQEIQDRS